MALTVSVRIRRDRRKNSSDEITDYSRHQAVGIVADRGKLARRFKIGARVKIGWINYACCRCPACISENENLCGDFRATGRDVHGGYAEYLAIKFTIIGTDAKVCQLIYNFLFFCTLKLMKSNKYVRLQIFYNTIYRE